MAVREFRIVPEGIHPLLLGMTREQTDRVMGEEPSLVGSRLPNEHVLLYGNTRVAMREGRAVEVSLVPPAKVFLQRRSLFDDPAVWRDLVAADGDAREALGFIVLPRLRLTLTGFHEGESGQLSISAFEAGRWDRLESEMKPLRL